MAGHPRSAGICRPAQDDLPAAVRRRLREPHQARAGRCRRPDAVRCQPDDAGAGRHLGAAPLAHARGRVRLRARRRGDARSPMRARKCSVRAWRPLSRPASPTRISSSTAASAPATYLEIGTRAVDDVITYPDDDLRSSSATAGASSCASRASPTNELRRHAAQGADPPLSLDAEALRRLELPAPADLLGVRAGGHRQERRLARPVADDVALVALPSVRYAGARPGARYHAPSGTLGALAVWPLALGCAASRR